MNKLMIRHTMDKPLPYDAEVEYIMSDGNAYIDLGIYGKCNFEIQAGIPRKGMDISGIFGSRVAYHSNAFLILWGQDERVDNEGGCIRMDYWDRTFLLGTPSANDVTITYNGSTLTDGTQTKVINSSATTTFGSHYLFAVNSNGNIIKALDGTYIRKAKIGDLDLIPVRKGNTGYLYDKVSGRLFGNQGTGSFVVGPDYNPFAYQYLTFVPLEDSTFSFSKRGTGNDIEYSIDGGAWTSLASGANTPTVGAGHNIRWRAELIPSTASGSQGIGTFSASGLYDAMGNTMSLLYGDNYIGQTALVGTYTFRKLWHDDTHIYRADRIVLPATTLAEYCYISMFMRCTSLKTTPDILPSTTLTSHCYDGMFFGCTSIATAPGLPATTLANYCCWGMFQGCTSLTTAPELSAKTLVTRCYYQMFNGCTNLNYVKCLATNKSASECTTNWLSGVAATGTFIKNANTTWARNASNIPSGWTVVDDPSTINS